MFPDPEFQVALRAVCAAAKVCQKVRSGLDQPSTVTKTDCSPVTVADYASQAVILRTLAGALPGARFVAEEDADSLAAPENQAVLREVVAVLQGQDFDWDEASVLEALASGNDRGGSGTFWTLDPIDGTKGFLRKDQYAVALAKVVDGQPVLGLLACPALPWPAWKDGARLGTVMGACHGQGAFQLPLQDAAAASPLPMRLRPDPKPEDAVFCESVESGHSHHGVGAQIASFFGTQAPTRRLDSQCKYGVVARSEGDVYFRYPTRPDYRENIWDHAAGVTLIQEAGGWVGDIDGQPLNFLRGRRLEDNRGVVACHPALREPLVAALRKIARA